MKHWLSVIILSIFIAACSSKGKPEPELTEREMYDDAKETLEKKSFLAAIEQLEKLEERFPFGSYSEQAQLDLIYAHYRNLDHGSSEAVASRFIRQNPGHPGIEYALYMKGLANYHLELGMFSHFALTDLSTRDLGSIRDAYFDFAKLVERFPDSQYGPDARSRMVHIRNLIAQSEVKSAQYYLRREAYAAAANRGVYVVAHFQETPAVVDALRVMVEAYYQLGLSDQAHDSDNLLVNQFPEERSQLEIIAEREQELREQLLNADQAREKSLLFKLTLGLLG